MRPADSEPAPGDIRRVALVLLLIAAVPTLVSLREALAVVMSAGYFGLYQREAEIGFAASESLLAGFLVPATLFLLAGSKRSRGLRIVSALIIVGYSLIRFFLGSRSSAAMPLIAYLWVWHSQVRSLRPSVLTGLAALMLGIVFPLVKTVRNVSGGERLSVDFLVESLLSIENPVLASIAEMGGSMGAIAYTLELVPGIREFDMGVGYIYALLTLIPNVLWDLHPTVARGLAADWLVWAVSPTIAKAGGGLGYSFIAEAYLNFGWYGAPAALGAVGFLFAKFTLWGSRTDEPAKAATVASFLAVFLFYARGESASVVRALVWYSVAPYLGTRVVNAVRPKGGRRGPCEIVDAPLRAYRGAPYDLRSTSAGKPDL